MNTPLPREPNTILNIDLAEYRLLMRIVKQAAALEKCIARSPINPNHPKFLLAKALKEFEEYKQ